MFLPERRGGPVRAGRLLRILLVLQAGGRVTAAELARRLEVSERTVLRDLAELGSTGVPVYAVRGRGGGFALLDTFAGPVPPLPGGLPSGRGRLLRVRVRISPAALQRALVLGRPEGWRARPFPDPVPDRPDWIEGTFRFLPYDDAVSELLALAPDVEVLLPVGLRDAIADVGRRLTAMHAVGTAHH
jgi:predicted DNA-binding transcriptional regulator YafY